MVICMECVRCFQEMSRSDPDNLEVGSAFIPGSSFGSWTSGSVLVPEPLCHPFCIGRGFGEEDATQQKSVKNSAFSLNESKAFSESRLWSGTLQKRQFSEEVLTIQ